MKTLSLHCAIVAEVMSELSADYWPGQRLVDAESMTVAVDSLAFPARPMGARVEVVTVAPITRQLPSGRASDATVDGQIVGMVRR